MIDIEKVKLSHKKRRERKLKEKKRNPIARELRENKLYRRRIMELKNRDHRSNKISIDQLLDEDWDEPLGSDEVRNGIRKEGERE